MPYNTNIIGHMVEDELKVIEEWAYNIPKNGVIVEIGTFFGRSAVCWAMSSDPSVKIYCGDIWPESFVTETYTHIIPGLPKSNFKYNLWQEFKNNVKEFSNIIPLRGFFPLGIKYPGDPIDIFFLDAMHTNPNDWDNLEYFKQFIKPTGMICGHDYSSHWPEVMENVNRLEKLMNRKATVYPGGSLWSISLAEPVDQIAITVDELQKIIDISRNSGGILKLRKQ